MPRCWYPPRRPSSSASCPCTAAPCRRARDPIRPDPACSPPSPSAGYSVFCLLGGITSLLALGQPCQLPPVEAYYDLLAYDGDGRGHSPQTFKFRKGFIVFRDVPDRELYAFRTEKLLRLVAEHSTRLDVQNNIFSIHRSSLLAPLDQDSMRKIRYLRDEGAY